MNSVSLDTYYDIHMHCPFCGKPATSDDGLLGCSHLIYVWLDECSFIYLSERNDNFFNKKGIKVTRADQEVFLEKIDKSYKDIDEIEYDVLESEILNEFSDPIVFEQTVPAPGFSQARTAFAFSEEEHQNYR